MIFCHRGLTLSPPADLRKGEVLTDSKGRQWAYTGDSRHSDRDGAVFVRHEERAPDRLPACQPPQAPQQQQGVKGEETCLITSYPYRQDLRVLRYDFSGQKAKTFQPQFYRDGDWHVGAGPEIWPFYGSLGAEGENCIIEAEGEKCVDVLRAQGIAAITHPGHQRDEQSCIQRYKWLAGAGIKLVYFISDNDAPGRKKAAAFAEHASKAGLTLKIIPAETIWPELPEGGSVDDMPAEQLSTLIPVAIKTAAGATPTPIDRTSFSKLKQALQAFYEQGYDSAADVSAGIADIAASHGVTLYDAKRIWDSLEEDRRAAHEASATVEALNKRRDLEARRGKIALEDFLPHEPAQAATELTGNLPCDSLVTIATILTTVAGALKAGHRIDAGDGLFVKEPVIWTLIAGESGGGKSPVMRILSRDRMGMVMAHYNAISDKLYDEWFARHGNSSNKRVPDAPDSLVTCVTDFTTESLAGIIADNHAQGLGTFIYSEEVKEILGNFDEYKTKGKGRGKEMFLCLFDGNVSTSFRVSRRGKMVAGKVQNALLGGVQPGVFRSMVENGDIAGLFGRCLIVPLPTEYVAPNFNRTPAEITTVHLAEKALENFYLRCATLDPMVLRLGPEAIEMFTRLSRDTYDKTQRVSLESQRAIYGKRMGYILQVALTLHLMRVAAGEESKDNLYLPLQTLARAVMFVDLLQSYAVIEQQESQMHQHGSFDMSRRIHSFAKARGGCTARDFLTASIPNKLRKSIRAFHVTAAMDQLVEIGLGEWKGQARVFHAVGKYPD